MRQPKYTAQAIYAAWKSSVTGSGATSVLGCATAVVTIITVIATMKQHTISPWPAAAFAGATMVWFFVSIPIAAFSVAHSERLGRLDAETAGSAFAADVTGEIELVQAIGWRFESAITSTSFTVWMRIVNGRDPSSLLRWQIQVKDHGGADVDCPVPYNQDMMPMRSGPPFASLHDLQNGMLETGRSAEVVIGFQLKRSIDSLDMETLRVSFSDSWNNRFSIGPMENMEIKYGVGN